MYLHYVYKMTFYIEIIAHMLYYGPVGEGLGQPDLNNVVQLNLNFHMKSMWWSSSHPCGWIIRKQSLFFFITNIFASLSLAM